MDMNDLTKEQVEGWSDAEVVFWASEFDRQNKVNQMRKNMLDFLDVRDAELSTNVIRIDSKVVDNA